MKRLNFLFLFFLFFTFLVITRLFYWQVKAGEKLSILAEAQRTFKVELPAQRGRIFSTDTFPLVDNQEGYLVYADLTKLENPISVAAKLAPILEIEEEIVKERLMNPNLVWVALKRKIEKEIKAKK